MFTPDLQSQLFEKLKFQATLFGYQSDNPNSTCTTRSLSDYELIYNVGGSTIVTLQGTRHILSAGDLILIPSLMEHAIDTPANDVHKNYWLHFSLEHSLLSQKLISSLLEAFGGYVFSIGMDDTLLSFYRVLLQEQQTQSAFSFFLCQSTCKQLFAYLLRHCHVTLDHALSTSHDLHDAVIDYVCKHYLEIEHVEQIAKHNNISQSYCNNIFKKYCGTSPAKYILHLKLKKAENLLRNTDQSIRTISEELRFSSQYHFANTFKAHYHLSPSAYRKLKFTF